ncbi:Heat-stable enterotoxin II [Citrobacter sp. A316]|uniref:Heat-stable enterotoxin II n=1 Tax=Citrobacter sp. A316 TaxID=1639132 RepID=UPI0009AD7E66|nr:Heat-stable enterotoxin II [Citrobacter sp. A316]OPW90875.1 Heat-stable enterotoxin II [Citrobacter sp. A316]
MNKYIKITILAASTIAFNSYAQHQSSSSSKQEICEHYRQIAKENCKKGFLGIRDGAAGACFGAQIMVKAKGC